MASACLSWPKRRSAEAPKRRGDARDLKPTRGRGGGVLERFGESAAAAEAAVSDFHAPGVPDGVEHGLLVVPADAAILDAMPATECGCCPSGHAAVDEHQLQPSGDTLFGEGVAHHPVGVVLCSSVRSLGYAMPRTVTTSSAAEGTRPVNLDSGRQQDAGALRPYIRQPASPEVRPPQRDTDWSGRADGAEHLAQMRGDQAEVGRAQPVRRRVRLVPVRIAQRLGADRVQPCDLVRRQCQLC